MRFVLKSLPRMVVMAAIVDSVLFVPLGGILALLSFGLLGVPLQSFVTLGGFVPAAEGLVIWWAIFLVPSLVYAAYMMPWHPK